MTILIKQLKLIKGLNLKLLNILLLSSLIFTGCSQHISNDKTKSPKKINKIDECKTIKDKKEEFNCYSKEANKGNVKYQKKLANYYLEKKDYKNALPWLEKLSIKNDRISTRELGYLYDQGFSVKKDKKKAFELFKKAAEQGDMKAQNEVGFYYEKGWAVQKNYKTALQWYIKTAQKENIYGLDKMGYFNAKGYGLKKNYKESFKWFKKSALNGSKYAMSWLGYQYEMGYGLDKNYEKAKALYEKSGSDYSKSRLELMRKKRLIKQLQTYVYKKG